MTWWDALLLGIIQGLTEFFPVSSSGHLVIGQAVLGVEVPGILFDVVVHVATLISVLIVYRQKLIDLITGAFGAGARSSWRYIGAVVVATVPAVIVGFTLLDWFEARFDDAVFAATMILVTGAVVWSSRWALGTRRFGPAEALPLGIALIFSVLAGTAAPFLGVLALEAVVMLVARVTAPDAVTREPGWMDAIIVGIAQAVAIFPGVTRSGSTVIAGLWRRVDPVIAAEFSFLMSIPAILGAAVLEVPDAMEAGVTVPPGALVVGFVAAAVSGIVAIRFFVALLRRQNFYMFAYYCWAIAGLFLLFRR